MSLFYCPTHKALEHISVKCAAATFYDHDATKRNGDAKRLNAEVCKAVARVAGEDVLRVSGDITGPLDELTELALRPTAPPSCTGDGREDGRYDFDDYERDFENDADIWYVHFTDSECPILFAPRHYGCDESEQMLRMLAALLNASKAGYAPASIPPQPWDWRTPNHPNKEALKGTQPQKSERDAAPAVTRETP